MVTVDLMIFDFGWSSGAAGKSTTVKSVASSLTVWTKLQHLKGRQLHEVSIEVLSTVV